MTYLKHIDHPFSRYVPQSDDYMERRCLVFLYAYGINEISAVTPSVRIAYDKYSAAMDPKKHTWQLRQLDNMVLSEIEKAKSFRKPVYKDALFYAGWYPDIRVAKKLTYIRHTKYLYFDFSINASSLMKRQIFSIIQSDFESVDTHRTGYIYEHLVTPLYYLYDYCIRYGINDLKQLTDDEASAFSDYLKDNMDVYYKCASQVLFRVRRILFLQDKKPDFTATLWFLERFNLTDRQNPAGTIDTFNFGDISSPDNRMYIQRYMKYLLILAPKYSAQSLKRKYLTAKSFALFLEGRNTSLTEISYTDIEDYIKQLDSMGTKPHTYNIQLASLSSLLTVLSVHEKLLIPSFPFEYYYKKEKYIHHDRTVSDDTIDRIFMVLPDFPETVGLIFLTLYSTGLRINEVCTMRKDAMKSSNEKCWLKVYQSKMRSEKEIPIPKELFRLLKRHIESDTSGSEYIFPRPSDTRRPYVARYFGEQMQLQLSLHEETSDIHFKSHDYRHTIATDLHLSGAPIAATRAFLGHKKEDMTKQYVDHLQGEIDELQDQYLKETDLK
ncbi:MAG: site-specific integrase [Lachnospiraceae bacterium]|nr:site-specific integrase [Lachnospiraceae bacterium]